MLCFLVFSPFVFIALMLWLQHTSHMNEFRRRLNHKWTDEDEKKLKDWIEQNKLD